MSWAYSLRLIFTSRARGETNRTLGRGNKIQIQILVVVDLKVKKFYLKSVQLGPILYVYIIYMLYTGPCVWSVNKVKDSDGALHLI